MTKLNRRDFLCALGAGGAMVGTLLGSGSPPPTSPLAKPISGSWFEFQHHATVEGVDWNPALANFTSDQWGLKIKEIAETGMEYLVLMATALYYRSFYRTKIFPAWRLACNDPMEAVLSAADKYGIKFFIGGGFYGAWDSLALWLIPWRQRNGYRQLTRSLDSTATTKASTDGTGRMRPLLIGTFRTNSSIMSTLVHDSRVS